MNNGLDDNDWKSKSNNNNFEDILINNNNNNEESISAIRKNDDDDDDVENQEGNLGEEQEEDDDYANDGYDDDFLEDGDDENQSDNLPRISTSQQHDAENVALQNFKVEKDGENENENTDFTISGPASGSKVRTSHEDDDTNAYNKNKNDYDNNEDYNKRKNDDEKPNNIIKIDIEKDTRFDKGSEILSKSQSGPHSGSGSRIASPQVGNSTGSRKAATP